jgi:hypothetical protein
VTTGLSGDGGSLGSTLTSVEPPDDFLVTTDFASSVEGDAVSSSGFGSVDVTVDATGSGSFVVGVCGAGVAASPGGGAARDNHAGIRCGANRNSQAIRTEPPIARANTTTMMIWSRRWVVMTESLGCRVPHGVNWLLHRMMPAV